MHHVIVENLFVHFITKAETMAFTKDFPNSKMAESSLEKGRLTCAAPNFGKQPLKGKTLALAGLAYRIKSSSKDTYHVALMAAYAVARQKQRQTLGVAIANTH